MSEKKFLQQVAEYYIGKDEDLSNLVMVFPNRRSSLFMRKYLQDTMSGTGFLPQMMSITYFTQQFSPATLAPANELVFLLYRVYCRVLTRHKKADQIPDFDNFFFWGTILLNDFNDVDAYLADAKTLFTNIKRLKEIKANYLTAEQKEVIEYLWGEQFAMEDDNIFWRHIRHGGNGEEEKPSDKFLNLWEIMYELYSDFQNALQEQNPPLAYSGMQSRHACEKIRSMGKDDFRGYRFAFVGFNVLSLARIKIFKRLQSLGIADFFWDTASPFLADTYGKPTAAGRQILPLAKRFAPPEDFHSLQLSGENDIEIISVPSNVGQTKVASRILNGWAEEWAKDSTDKKVDETFLIETAVVMADENLLVPLLHSVPENIPTINITMGVSYKSTPFSALMSAIISMHLRSYKIRDDYHYFYQDVLNVVSHPHITLIAPESSAGIKDWIMKNHIFNINARNLMSQFSDLAFIFTPITEEKQIDNVKAYIETLIKNLTEKLRKSANTLSGKGLYEIDILQGYADEMQHLCDMMKKYNIQVREHTFLQMIERTMLTKPISFTGQPLKGLQLMGVMDTRTLDFDNVIMMSLNEKTFPRRTYSPSLISMNLRSCYGLPTQEQEECSYAYQFYRIISRAKRVRLLYDSRTSGVSSGERSRYLSQLVFLNKDNHPRLRTVELNKGKNEVKEVVIEKTPKIVKELNEFLPNGKLYFSASAFKTYFQCPVRFYFEYVKKLRIYEETIDYIDAASYGTATHHVVQELYETYAKVPGKSNTLVTSQVIDMMINSDIESLAMKVLNEEYYHGDYTGRMDRMPGEGKVTSLLIAKYVRKMLGIEKEMAQKEPYIFLSNEFGQGKKYHWTISDKYTINFKMSIDRVDILRDSAVPEERELRFIDYKTGDDALSCRDMNSMLSNHQKSAIFQLLLYCYAYADLKGHKGGIVPMIYKFQTIATDGIKKLKINGKDLTDYRQADNIGFMEAFREKVEEIFNPEIPFKQTKDLENCRYCPFKQICGRYPDERDF